MVTYLKNNDIGAYIVEEQGANISGNTPGNIDLDLLTEGDTYIYINDVLNLTYTINNRYGERFPGFELWSYGGGKTEYFTTEGQQVGLILRGVINNSNSFKVEKFCKLNNRVGDPQKYLVRMYATGAASGANFRSFSDGAGTQKYYTPVIAYIYSDTEKDSAGKDNINFEIQMVEVWTT